MQSVNTGPCGVPELGHRSWHGLLRGPLVFADEAAEDESALDPLPGEVGDAAFGSCSRRPPQPTFETENQQNISRNTVYKAWRLPRPRPQPDPKLSVRVSAPPQGRVLRAIGQLETRALGEAAVSLASRRALVWAAVGLPVA